MYQNASSWHDVVSFQHESFIHGVAMSGTSLCFDYILPSKSPNGILFIKQYFQIEITNNLERV